MTSIFLSFKICTGGYVLVQNVKNSGSSGSSDLNVWSKMPCFFKSGHDLVLTDAALSAALFIVSVVLDTTSSIRKQLSKLQPYLQWLRLR